jgi:carboxyl-terminal processing protease
MNHARDFAPFRSTALLICLGLLGGCASFDPNRVIARQLVPAESAVPVPSTSSTLNTEQREQAFDFVWTTINERYYDPKMNGVDWRATSSRFRSRAIGAADDEAFWDELDRMTGELKDSHTRVESPRRVEARKNNEGVTLGLSLMVIDNALVVASVNSNADAWWAGVRPGMTVQTIDGVPAMEAYRKLYAETRDSSSPRARHLSAVGRFNRGAPDTKVAMSFKRADGTDLSATLKRSRIASPPLAQSRKLPSGMGYIRFSNFMPSLNNAVVQGFRDLHDAPGLIIDLRGNGGGSLTMTRDLVSHLFKDKTPLTKQLTRDGKPITVGWGLVDVIKLEYDTSPMSNAYTGPVVVLVNEGSGSGSEYFASTLQALGRAKVVGQTSCGCLLGFLGYAPIPGGGELAYSEVGFVTANGKRIEGDGVVPDLTVPVTQADLQIYRDRTLEVAEAMLAVETAKRSTSAKSVTK